MSRGGTPPDPAWVARELATLDASDARRNLTVIDSLPGARVRAEGAELLNFSSNDYLGLAARPEVRRAAADAALRWGAGSTASRLITGTLGIHRELEKRLADLKGTGDALLFSSGYQANVGILQALMQEGVIFSDELNHASIVDGCRLARAETRVYRHKKVGHLRFLLEEHSAEPRKCIVTDSVFSMDGDLAPLAELAELAEEHGAILVVDDAHATGVLGRNGRGSADHLGVAGRVHVQMGTLGKALGSFGAFAAASGAIRDLLLNRARSFVYTTAPAPAAAGAALAALDLLEGEPGLVAVLHRNVLRLREGLREIGFPVSGDPTPIVPIVLGENRRALAWAGELRKMGFWVHPIRPPTVPEGSARLRVTVTAAHTDKDIEALLHAFRVLLHVEPRLK